MHDLIYRQDAIDALSCDITLGGRQNAKLVAATIIGTFVDRIKALPSVTPKRKTGKWEEKNIVYKDDRGFNSIEAWQSARCSKCGKYHTTPYAYYFDDYNFCPNCGTKMGG